LYPDVFLVKLTQNINAFFLLKPLKKPEWIRNFEMYDARFIKTLFIPVTLRLARKRASPNRKKSLFLPAILGKLPLVN